MGGKKGWDESKKVKRPPFAVGHTVYAGGAGVEIGPF